ncbi:hypothetical protein [Acinetobacter bereziniae]|uniref:hypothetical protein n=1 Tax=Acinetobacter bereziniae TaxID=106648 RepID=UPI000C2C6C96|nr:hypothetical protein [Acinetobacter bereziniae]ATZ65273.1 hypothetical protein BSR55_19065 [Acinetobacter bereziniae]
MYIYLENDLANLDFRLEENEELLDFFCDLIYKSFKGKFILDGKKALRNIAKYAGEERIIKKINFIIQRNMEYRGVFNSLNFKINISKSYTNVERNNFSINIPLDIFFTYDFGYVDFIAEDFNDSDYIDQAIRSFQVLKDELGIFNVKYNKINGGGANTPNVYEHHLNSKLNYVICLCDSDKYSPKGPFGINARECLKKLKTDTIGRLFITHGREIENDIPYPLLFQTFSNDPSTLRKISELPCYKEYICEQILKYADLKKGVLLSWVDKIPASSENEKYWSNQSRFIMDNFWHKIIDDKVVLVPGVSEKLLKNVSQFLKKKSDQELKEFLISHNASSNDEFYQFISLGEDFFWILFSFCDKKFVA